MNDAISELAGQDWRVVDAKKWASVSFSGAQIAVTGPPIDPDLELDVRGMIVADMYCEGNRTQFLLVDDDLPLTMPEASQRLLTALRARAKQ